MTSNVMEEMHKDLEGKIHILFEKMSSLDSRMEAIEKRISTQTVDQSASQDDTAWDMSMPSLDIWSTVSKTTFLPKLSAISFILVIALILRTLTDSGTLSHHTGSVLGIGYATALIVVGWRLLNKASKIAGVFPISGAVLMYTIILETFSRFASFSATTSYLVLFVTLMSLVMLGKRFDKNIFYAVGLLGATITALLIDFPRPIFYQLAAFIFSANLTALYFSEVPRSKWVQVTLFIMTLLFWFFWTIKIHVPLAKNMDVAPYVSTLWFIPFTLLMAFSYIRFSFQNSFNRGDSIGLFEIILPTTTAAGAYIACWTVVDVWLGHGRWIGCAGLFIAVIHYLAAWILFKYSRNGGPGICAFTFAASTLLLLASFSAIGNIYLVLPFLSAVALGLLFSSSACEIGGIRLASYLMQSIACVMAIGYGAYSPGILTPVPSFFVAASLALLSGFHYFLSRKRPLSCHTGFFFAVDPYDRTAVILLFTALINSFCMLQLGGYYILAIFTDNLHNALMGLQSVLINIGAVMLMLLGLKGRHREILYTAIAVVIMGAFKVFGFDLFKANGIALVTSVSSFGAVAAVGSVILGRWNQIQKKTTI